MTSTRRLRRVESENQIWLVIAIATYNIEWESEILMKLHDALFFFVFYRENYRQISSSNYSSRNDGAEGLQADGTCPQRLSEGDGIGKRR